VIVYATGYGSMNGWVAELISKEMADKVGKAGASAPTPPRTPAPGRASSATCGSRRSRKALWFHGGNLHQSRHYSQFLALQLKARMEGIPTPVYGHVDAHAVSAALNATLGDIADVNPQPIAE
jgi:putative flavoprotein involved in K+ transport